MKVETMLRKPRESVPASAGITDQSGSPEASGDRLQFIATAAYYKAQARGFEPGGELEDWLTAEAEFEQQQCH